MGTVVVGLEGGGGPALVDLCCGVEPDVVEVGAEPLADVAAGNAPSVSRAGLVWKLSTATNPTIVATMTIVARFIGVAR